MKKQLEESLKREIEHIFDSGANEIRILEMLKNFINKNYVEKITEPLIVEFEDWEYSCSDGCCTDYGTRIYINDKKLEHPHSTTEEYIPSDYIGGEATTAVEAVLKKFGYNPIISHK